MKLRKIHNRIWNIIYFGYEEHIMQRYEVRKLPVKYMFGYPYVQATRSRELYGED